MKKFVKKLIVLVMVVALVLPMVPVVKTSAATALITVAKYEERLKSFMADSRFKNGATWEYEQRPKLNTGWSCKGCCAYAADFVKYVYGVNTAPKLSDNFLKYTDINDIKKGDIIYINDAKNHWFVVLKRNGNSLDVVEGNYGGKVRHADDGYRIKDGKLYDVKSKNSRPFGYGFHYKFADSMFTVQYDANGGVGDIASKKLNFGAKFSLPTSGFTRDEYELCGWKVQRSDGKWFVDNQNGWLDEKTMNEKGLKPRLYDLDGKTFTMNSNWTTGVERGTTFTFYAYWGFNEYTVKCFDNYSGVNLLHDGAFEGELDSEWYLTRDESVLTLDIDSEVKRIPEYNTLRVDSLAVGKSGKDLGIRTFTSGSSTGNGYVGDDKEMTLSFWAKADTDDINMYVRWGYEPSSEYKKVSFTTEWKYYTVRMDKQNTFGNTMHPYFDAPGKVWFSEMQLEEGTEPTAFKNDTGEYNTILVRSDGTYDTLPVPERDGYVFDGWYTAVEGGTKVDANTPAPAANTVLYARWEKDSAPDTVLNGWVYINNAWYFYGEDGVPVTNTWQRDSKGWVYLGDDDGAMLTNAWCTDSKGWCYVGADGYAVTNCWKRDAIGWIWLDGNGSMTKNAWIKTDGKWYYLDQNGYMVTNTWKKDSKGWVYLGADGYMLTNAWARDSVGWCYLGADGYAVTNTWKQDSVGWCYLNSNGSMTKNQWVYSGGKWYYLNSNGYMATNTWMLDSKGWCYLGADGAMVTNTWVRDSSGWCYIGADGYMA